MASLLAFAGEWVDNSGLWTSAPEEQLILDGPLASDGISCMSPILPASLRLWLSVLVKSRPSQYHDLSAHVSTLGYVLL